MWEEGAEGRASEAEGEARGGGREAGAKAFRSSVMCGPFGTVCGFSLSIFKP